MEKYLIWGLGVRTEHSKIHAPWPRAKYFAIRPNLAQSIIILFDPILCLVLMENVEKLLVNSRWMLKCMCAKWTDGACGLDGFFWTGFHQPIWSCFCNSLNAFSVKLHHKRAVQWYDWIGAATVSHTITSLCANLKLNWSKLDFKATWWFAAFSSELLNYYCYLFFFIGNHFLGYFWLVQLIWSECTCNVPANFSKHEIHILWAPEFLKMIRQILKAFRLW